MLNDFEHHKLWIAEWPFIALRAELLRQGKQKNEKNAWIWRV